MNHFACHGSTLFTALFAHSFRTLKLLHIMSMLPLAVVVWGFATIATGLGQTSPGAGDFSRVTMSMHPDGSRTTYAFDNPNRKATATTTAPDGKVREKIDYVLNDAGQFSSGIVYDAAGKIRFKTEYKYDPGSGRLLEEAQLDKGGTLLHRIVYAYDGAGKQTGYNIVDANGKVLSRTTAPTRK